MAQANTKVPEAALRSVILLPVFGPLKISFPFLNPVNCRAYCMWDPITPGRENRFAGGVCVFGGGIQANIAGIKSSTWKFFGPLRNAWYISSVVF